MGLKEHECEETHDRPRTLGSNRPSHVRILIVDDHPAVHAALELYLHNLTELRRLDHAADGAEALSRVGASAPDLVLMDVGMPGLDGITATEILKALNPALRILAFSARSDERAISAMMQAGARGYIVKDATREELLAGILRVLHGGTFFSKTVWRVLSGRVPNSHANGFLPSNAVALSDYEKRVVSLVASGLGTKEVATVLGREVRAIEKCRERISKKLGIRGIAGITRYAVQARLVMENLRINAPPTSPPRQPAPDTESNDSHSGNACGQ